MKTGAEQLRAWMSKRQFNQAETAGYLGEPEALISMLLNGKRTLGLAKAVKFERETGIPVEAWLSSACDDSVEPVGPGAHKSQDNKA